MMVFTPGRADVIRCEPTRSRLLSREFP